MKNLIIVFLVLSIVIVTVVTKYNYPYRYLPITKYWSVTELGFSKIKEADDFRLYYLDKMDAKGYNKKEIRYSAFHQAYRNSATGSYVKVDALMNISYAVDKNEDKMYLQKRILDENLYFQNRCYYDNCSNGHNIVGIAQRYARNLRKTGDFDGAFNILKNVYLARKYDLQPWVRFSLLEDVYFVLNKKTISEHELEFFTKQVADMGADFSDERLAARYKNLLKWKKELRLKI